MLVRYHSINLGSPVPNKVIAWKVSIIPITVPNKPNKGATAANSFIVLRFFSYKGPILESTAQFWFQLVQDLMSFYRI